MNDWTAFPGKRSKGGHGRPSANLSVEPLTPTLGAKIRGLDFRSPLDNSVKVELQAALERYLVLFIAGQKLSPMELKNFTGQFGPVFRHPTLEGMTEAPEVLELRFEPGDARLFGGECWHADVTYLKPAGYLSVLHAVEVPAMGGDTCFASTAAAFACLSPALQDFLSTLKAVHSFDGPGKPERDGMTAVHPVVRRNPATGVAGLYLNAMFTTRFDGMTAEESRPLIEFLTGHLSKAEFTCRWQWRNGDAALWDNRFTLHYPIQDEITSRRIMIRATALEPVN